MRTFNCLERAGVSTRIRMLERTTIGQLMAMPAFGTPSLLDLLAACEARPRGELPEDELLALRAKESAADGLWLRLREIPGATEIESTDVRFGDLVRSLDPGAHDLQDAFIGSKNTGSLATDLGVNVLAKLVGALRDALDLPLEDELRQLAHVAKSPRQITLVCKRLGWLGDPPRTLEDVGLEYGLTRERVRQIEKKVKLSQANGPLTSREVVDFRGGLPGWKST